MYCVCSTETQTVHTFWEGHEVHDIREIHDILDLDVPFQAHVATVYKHFS